MEFVTWSVVIRRTSGGLGDRWFPDTGMEGAACASDVIIPDAIANAFVNGPPHGREDNKADGRARKELSLPAGFASPPLHALYTPVEGNVPVTFIGLRLLLGTSFPSAAAIPPVLLCGAAGSGKTVLSKVLLAAVATTVGCGNNAGGLVAYLGSDGLGAQRNYGTPADEEEDGRRGRAVTPEALLLRHWPQVVRHSKHSKALQSACESVGVWLAQYHVNTAALGQPGSGLDAGATPRVVTHDADGGVSPSAGLLRNIIGYTPVISGVWESLSPKKVGPTFRRPSSACSYILFLLYPFSVPVLLLYLLFCSTLRVFVCVSVLPAPAPTAVGSSFFGATPSRPASPTMPAEAQSFVAFSRQTTAQDPFVLAYDTLHLHGASHGHSGRSLQAALIASTVPVGGTGGTRLYGPPHPHNGALLVCVDDLHLASPSAQALTRQAVEGACWYEAGEGGTAPTPCAFSRVAIVGTTSSTSSLSQRLRRHLTTLCVEAPTPSSLYSVYSSVLYTGVSQLCVTGLVALYKAEEPDGTGIGLPAATHLSSYGPTEGSMAAVLSTAQETCDKVLKALADFHKGVRKTVASGAEVAPTLLSVGRVVMGLLGQLTPPAALSPASIVAIWRHEVFRCVECHPSRCFCLLFLLGCVCRDV